MQSYTCPFLSCKTAQRRKDVEFLYIMKAFTAKEAFSPYESEGMCNSPKAQQEGYLRVQSLWHRLGGLQRGEGDKPGVALSILPLWELSLVQAVWNLDQTLSRQSIKP